MNQTPRIGPAQHRWPAKFVAAISGLFWAVRTQNSFWVHLPVAAAVLAVAAWLQLESWRWVALLLAIGGVLTAELLNTATEELVKVVHPRYDRRIGHALDAAAAGVLVISCTAVLIGLIVLVPPLMTRLYSAG